MGKRTGQGTLLERCKIEERLGLFHSIVGDINFYGFACTPPPTIIDEMIRGAQRLTNINDFQGPSASVHNDIFTEYRAFLPFVI